MARSSCTHCLKTPVTRAEHKLVRDAALRHSVSMAALLRLMIAEYGTMQEKTLDRLAGQLGKHRDKDLKTRRYNWSGCVLRLIQAGARTEREIRERCTIQVDWAQGNLTRAIQRLLAAGKIAKRRKGGLVVLEIR